MINRVCFSQSIGGVAVEGQCAYVNICISKSPISNGPIGNPYHFVLLYFIFIFPISSSLTIIDSSLRIYSLETAVGFKCQNVFRKLIHPCSPWLILGLLPSPSLSLSVFPPLSLSLSPTSLIFSLLLCISFLSSHLSFPSSPRLQTMLLQVFSVITFSRADL